MNSNQRKRRLNNLIYKGKLYEATDLVWDMYHIWAKRRSYIYSENRQHIMEWAKSTSDQKLSLITDVNNYRESVRGNLIIPLINELKQELDTRIDKQLGILT